VVIRRFLRAFSVKKENLKSFKKIINKFLKDKEYESQILELYKRKVNNIKLRDEK